MALISSLFISLIILANQYYTSPNIMEEGLFPLFYIIPFIIILTLICIYLKIEKRVFLPFLWVLPLNFTYLYLAYNTHIGMYEGFLAGLVYVYLPIFVYIYMGIFLFIYLLMRFVSYLKSRQINE